MSVLTLSAPERFEAALARFDQENALDPNLEWDGTKQVARELLYARRLSEWVLRLCPTASEELRLAARCQHLCRWRIPRDRYPMDRAGYHRWRTELKKMHATMAGEILRQVGYPEAAVQRVQSLNLKQDFPNDPEGRVLEDALCLVFLQFQLEDLASKTPVEKVINALRKSWRKMSPAGQEAALKLEHSAHVRSLLEQSVGGS